MTIFRRDGCFRWSIKGLSLWRAGGGPGVPYVYGFGFWCGKNDDLLCIRDFGQMETNILGPHLSPLRHNMFLAFALFLNKWRGDYELSAGRDSGQGDSGSHRP